MYKLRYMKMYEIINNFFNCLNYKYIHSFYYQYTLAKFGNIILSLFLYLNKLQLIVFVIITIHVIQY